MIGTTLGPYRIVERLGRGGMATVYKAYQPSLDRYVALKVLPAHLTDEPGFAERFRREARAVAKLEHPHILAVHDYGQEGDLTYIAMRYVEGGTLKDLLGKPLELPLAVDLIGQIADALDHAHEHGVIHRDVKPSNVLLDRGNWALLTDFGVARMVEATQQLTGTGVGVGTPAYMSPEQGQGKKVDRRSDVYSLGVVLYEMLTGRVPFEAETPLAVVWKHANEPLPLPRILNPEIPEAVEQVVTKALAKNPVDRFQNAGGVADALADSGRHGFTRPGSVGTSSQPRSATRAVAAGRGDGPSKRARWLLPAAVLTGLLVGFMILWDFLGDRDVDIIPGAVAGLYSETADQQGPPSEVESVSPSPTALSGTMPTDMGTTPALLEELPAYDEFENVAFDGMYDGSKWHEDFQSGCSAWQEGGILVFGRAPGQVRECVLTARQPPLTDEIDAGAIQAQVLVANDHTGGTVFQGVRLISGSETANWYAMCGLRAGDRGVEGIFDVSVRGGKYFFESVPATYEEWYTARLEISLAEGGARCYLNGLVFGETSLDGFQLSDIQSIAAQILAFRHVYSSATTKVDNVALVLP